MTPEPGEQFRIADLLRELGDRASSISETDLQLLVDTLRTQGQQYSDLMALLETLNTEANVHETHSQAVLNSIQHQLGNLTTTGNRLTHLQTRLGSDVTKSSPELQSELKHQENLMQNCLERIASLETHFVERRKRLKPELDESARRRSMQSAYQRSLKTG